MLMLVVAEIYHISKKVRNELNLTAEFNDLYLQNLLDTITFQNKDIFLMGDLNIDILQYDNNKDSQEFLDKMHSNFLMPYISSPSRVTPRSQTLIDNIFSNKIEEESFSGNITNTVSDHYAQFLLLKTTIYLRGRKRGNKFEITKRLIKKLWDRFKIYLLESGFKAKPR